MVSVILINYNGSKDTLECIESIEKSNYHEYHIIGVDNCSSDDSVKKLKEMQKHHIFELIESPINNGFSAGNNIGIKRAIELKSDYIWLLNNDTIINPNTIDELMKGFIYSKQCGVTIGKILYEKKRNQIWYAGGSISSKTARTKHWHYNENDEDADKKNIEVSFATGCCLFMSKDSILKVGLMDEDYFLYEEDADYSLRMTKAGIQIIYCPKAMIYHKVSASTGKASDLMQYYFVRNNYKGICKVIAYIYNTLQMLYRCMKSELSFKNYRKGLSAFCSNKTGKWVSEI